MSSSEKLLAVRWINAKSKGYVDAFPASAFASEGVTEHDAALVGIAVQRGTERLQRVAGTRSPGRSALGSSLLRSRQYVYGSGLRGGCDWRW